MQGQEIEAARVASVINGAACVPYTVMQPKGVAPLWRGKYLTLVSMAFSMHTDADGSAGYRGRIALMIGPSTVEYPGAADSSHGIVAAMEKAARAALVLARVELPTVDLVSYEVRIASGRRSTTAPVIAKARAVVDGRPRTIFVRHADTATAGAMLVVHVLDAMLFEQWSARLRRAGVTPQMALAAMAHHRGASGSWDAEPQ